MKTAEDQNFLKWEKSERMEKEWRNVKSASYGSIKNARKSQTTYLKMTALNIFVPNVKLPKEDCRRNNVCPHQTCYVFSIQFIQCFLRHFIMLFMRKLLRDFI